MTAVSEAGLQRAIIDMAHLFGWRVAHFRPSLNSRGEWRTAVSADGAGFPDLVMARRGCVVIAELKSSTGHLTVPQKDWLAELCGPKGTPDSRLRVFAWTPADWLSGAIDAVLR